MLEILLLCDCAFEYMLPTPPILCPRCGIGTPGGELLFRTCSPISSQWGMRNTGARPNDQSLKQDDKQHIH